MAEKLHFTKVRIDALPIPAKRTYYRDLKERRLGLYVLPSGRKSFYVQMCINGKTRRVQLGKSPDLSVARARQLCAKTLSNLAEHGTDPVAKRREREATSVTLREALEVYLTERTLKDTTKADYHRAITELCADWLDRPMADIKPDEVLKRYLQRGERSRARTDNGRRVLKAIFNFAAARYKSPDGSAILRHNPTDLINETRTKFRIERKRRVLASADIAAWWQAVNCLNNKIARDWLAFLLFTGTRRSESASLRWENVNLRERSFDLLDPKNRRACVLPLPDTIVQMIRPRRPRNGKGWLFPTTSGLTGYLSDPRKSITHVRRESGVEFSPHDCRRTFATIANGLDISVYSVKALLNHAVSASDMTQRYDLPDLERLRDASSRIERRILSLTHAEEAKIVPLRHV